MHDIDNSMYHTKHLTNFVTFIEAVVLVLAAAAAAVVIVVLVVVQLSALPVFKF